VKTKPKTVITIVLVVIVVALLASLMIFKNNKGPGSKNAPGGPGASQGPTVYSVQTAVLKTGSLQSYLDLTGNVVTQTDVEVFSDVGGKLASVNVKVGDIVYKGSSVIATIDPSKPGSNYALSVVYSPLTGTVTSVDAQLGATVSTSTSLATVGVMSDLYVESKVPEQNIAALRAGLHANITFEAYPGIVFPAVVERVSPTVDTTSRTKTARLRFLRQDSRVSPGMFGRIQLFQDARPAHVLVPQDAIVTQSGISGAFVVENNKAFRRTVTVGTTVDGISEILTGLSAGQILVTKGQELLDDNVQVRVINDSATPVGGKGQ